MSDTRRDAREVSWRETHRDTLFSHPLFTLHKSCQTSSEGGRGDFILLDCPDWVNVVVLDHDESGRPCLLLVRQYRFGLGDQCLEFPGGVVDRGENHGEAARRELLEETGFEADEWIHLGSACPNAAFMTNRMHGWLARGLRRVGELSLDEHEHLTVHRIPLAEIREGRHPEFLTNGVMVLPWFWFLSRFPEYAVPVRQ